ncbi:hypothetical protein GCM10027174_38920 [Salinifilum aidingensis]
MLIGPATGGALLEIGVLDLDGDDPVIIHAMGLRAKFHQLLQPPEVIKMRHSDDEIEQAAHRFEQLADDLDPATATAERTTDLRGSLPPPKLHAPTRPGCTRQFKSPRAHGRSWNQIATALGVPRQAARQRFADKQPT